MSQVSDDKWRILPLNGPVFGRQVRKGALADFSGILVRWIAHDAQSY